MKHNYFKSNQCEEMARNLWVYLYTQMGVKSAKSMSAGSEAEGRKTEGRASNEHPLSIHSASIEHPLQVQGKAVKMPLHFLRYAAMIFMVFMVGIGNVWGADFTPTQIIASGGTTTDNVKVSSTITSASGRKLCSSQTSVSSVQISSAASNNYNTHYIEVKATSGTLSSLSLKIRGNTDGTGAIVMVFWSGDAAASFASYSNSYNYIARDGSDCDGSVVVSLPANTKTVRIYKSIKVKDGAFSSASGYTQVDAGASLNIFGITATAGAASTWYVKGTMNEWGTTDPLTGTGTTLTANISLSANTQYKFKIVDTDGVGTWHTNTGTIRMTVSNLDFSTTGGFNNDCYIRTSKSGTYTFSYNTSTNKLSVTYPDDYKGYWTKNGASWSKVYAYCYNDGTWKNADWPGVEITDQTEDICGTHYYINTSGYTTVIFNNGGSGSGNQTENIAISGGEGKHAVGAAATAFEAFPTYTVTYNKNGDGEGGAGSVTGSVPTDSNSPYACGSTITVLGNTGSLALDGYTFAGWNTAPGGGGTSYAAAATFTISANTTLYAQWEEAATCSGDPTALVSGTLYQVSDMASACLGEITSTGQYFYGLSSNGKFYINGTTNSNNASTGTVEIKTASNTIDKVNFTGIAWFKGAGTNTCRSIKFVVPSAGTLTIYGKTSRSKGNVVIKTESSGNTTVIANSVNAYASGSTTVSAGTYYVLSDGESAAIVGLKFVEESCSATQPGAISKGTLSACTLRLTAGGSPAANNTWYWQSSADGTDKTESGATKDVTTTGTYYIRSYCTTGTCWSEAQSVTVSASDLTPAAPTALAKSAETAKGATLTITDGANTNDYDFYVSTNSSAPGDGTSASYTSTNKSITITDKVAGTTYYAWARAKCGSNKSAWTALTGNTFTTSTVTVTHTLTNVSKTSGEATAGGSDYTAVYAADAEYSMPTPTVTIGGNAATSGTHYTWSVDGSVGTITIPANKINGNIVITLNSVPSAPSSAVISGTYHYFPGENISLTVTPSGNNGPTTYQWYKGGKADGNRIDGATSATYTKNSCTFDDAGSYYCKVTCNATSIWAVTNSHENYDVKILRLYVKGSKGGQDYGNVDFVKVNSTTATASISLGSNWTYGFNIADGCGHYYGNSGTMQYNSYGPWVTNQNGVDCGLTTTNAATYVFTINYSNLEMIETTVTFPSGNQTSGKVIYFDNNDLQWENVYYRIGKSNHVQSAAMTKVYGTANLYQYTTPTYDNFAGWHITNAAGATGSYSVYNTKNGTAITEATAFEGAAVTQAAVTVTPTSSHATGETSDNNNCEFYTYGITTGMKTQNVSITAPSNGTLTVNYVDVNNVGQAFSSGNRDLAHTCFITVTAVPSTGYAEPATVSINGASHGNRDPYTITGTTVVAATFTAKTYNITLDRNGASSGSESVTMTYNSSSHTAITAPVKAGYTFDGWYDSETDNNGSGNLVMNASGVLQENVTGFTGADGIWIKDATCTLYAKWTAAAGDCDLYFWFNAAADATTAGVTNNEGSFFGSLPSSSANSVTGSIVIDGTTYNVTQRASNTKPNITFTVPSGKTGKLYAIVHGNSDGRSVILKQGDTEKQSIAWENDCVGHEFNVVPAGNYTITSSKNVGWCMLAVKVCDALSPCTTPVIPALSNQSLCEGTDIAAWNATVTNAAAIEAAGESISYSWKKKGNDTELENTATFDLGSSATESQAGTYVVTVTVSKAGKASSSAYREVELSVTEETEVTNITADKATVYAGNSVTLTATANVSATWQWYTCTNAEGDGESSIGGATSAAYAFTAPASAGTYYYKVKATSSCGTAERVYALTVSQPSECIEWAGTPNSLTNNSMVVSENLILGVSGASINNAAIWSGSGNITHFQVNGSNYYVEGHFVDGSDISSVTVSAATNQSSSKTYAIVFSPDDAFSAGLTVYTHSAPSVNVAKNESNLVHEFTAPANTQYFRIYRKFTYSETDYGDNQTIRVYGIEACAASSCTDATPTITAANTTVCSDSELSISASGYESDPTSIQWQKLNGSAWDNISGATAATYTVASATAADAGSYRVVVTKGCARTSNTVTISVPAVPVFGSLGGARSVMTTSSLSITDVEASDATSYTWYKSANNTYEPGTDEQIGTSKDLLIGTVSEAAGSTFYLFCVASNSCGSTTSGAITVNVTAFVEEECATKGNEGDAEFDFTNTGCGSGNFPNTSTPCWNTNSKNKFLTYTVPEGKYFKTAKVTVGVSGGTTAAYGYSTDSISWTYVTLSDLTTSLAEKTINLTGNIKYFRIGRNFDPSYGQTSNTFYLSKACFEYTNACTSTSVTPSTSSVAYTMGGAWSNPTFTLAPAAVASGTLAYSSSDEDIAIVDENGIVSFNDKSGTVTITASYAGATISETDYCASSGSYTITVSCSGGAPKVVASGASVDCNSSITLLAKTQSDGDFADGTYQWFRNGEEIDGATSSSYTATQAGTYTVERTNASDCTTPSTNSAVVTSETTEPEVERLVPFQYYHVDKTYSDQMKMRHLFAVKNSGKLDGKSFKMYVSRNGGAATDVTSSNALVVWPNGDGHVDTVMVDLNKLSGKYEEDDELVFTCKAIDCTPAVSETYKATITMHVIDTDTATLALICSGTSKAEGTRKTGELTVGGDFLTGYNVADLCQQTGNTSFDANTEWGLYTDLKTQYIVTPVNGYAVFNKLNYEPFDILLLTDYPKASKSDAAADVLDDMAALCDYRPMLSFKTHMVAKSPSKWAEKGFTTSPVVTKADGRLNLNIVCYAHPMFEGLKSGEDVYEDVNNTSAPLVYTMLTGEGYEGSKGMQGFELAAAENFITIGLTHYNGTITKDSPDPGEVEWTPGSEDRMLVTVAERQANPEARFILFSLNCGAQSKLTDKGEEVVLACLNYLLGTAEGTIEPADCSFTFDNGENNEHNAAWYTSNCPLCTGTKGDGLWTTAANWGPDYRLLPGEFTSVRIKAPVEVNDEHAHVMEVRIIDEGRIDIPAGKALDVKSTIRRMDGSEIYPTEEGDIHIGSASTGNGTLIFNNDEGDTKARVDMYSNAQADVEHMSAATSVWQYIGTPHTDVANARSNYYGSWLYQYSGSGWTVIPNGGPLVAFRGYCITNETAPVVYDMAGTLAATTSQDIAIPAGYTVIANSWTAPIDINAITDDDMEGISDKSIYFFNTGTDADGNHGTGTEAGTYRTTPIHSASYTGDWQIPSMQGFYISTETAGTLHLDYERHVRPHSARTVVGNPMYAPKRAAAESDEPNVLKIFARGSRYQDKLVVLEREDFTRGYDSGWDGEAWGGGTLSPMVYVIGEGREDAVSAIPEFEGTVIAFKAGEDSEYRFEFTYSEDAEPLYLLDTENNTYTQVITGNAYYFTTTDKAAHSRFILTRKAPQIATGTELTSNGEGAKARKLLIEDKMYILLNGMLYDATGKVVK